MEDDITEEMVYNNLQYLIKEGFVKVIIGDNGVERYRLKTDAEIQEELTQVL